MGSKISALVCTTRITLIANQVEARGKMVTCTEGIVLDFRVPVSYSRTIIVFVGIRYKHLRVYDERSEFL